MLTPSLPALSNRFRDSKSQDIQVLYRRDAGGYGILVPRQ